MEHDVRRLAYGVDLGCTTIKVGLVDESGSVVWRSSMPTPSSQGAQGILDDVAALVTGAAHDRGVSHGQTMGIGVGLPGLVDADKGISGMMANLDGWEGFPVADYLAQSLGIEARIDHDLRVFTRGEMRCGAARGLRNFALATVGTGVGVCIVIDGKIYRRSTGDMGHTTIDYQGLPCPCGSVGCLERYVSGPVLDAMIRDGVHAGKLDAIVSANELADMARSGHAWAKEAFDRIGRCLGFGVLNVVAIVNPEVFIIGGGLARAGDLLLEPVIEVLEQHAFMFADARNRVRLAQLGDDAGIIGAASLILAKED